MSKYIDAEELLKRLNACKYSAEKTTKRQVTYNAAISDACRIVDALPAADVQEVRHGRWDKDNDTAFFWKCRECGAYLFWRKEEYLLRDTDEPNYCPNCGAKMVNEDE